MIEESRIIRPETFLKETLSITTDRFLRLRYFTAIFLIMLVLMSLVGVGIIYFRRIEDKKWLNQKVAAELDGIKLAISLDIKETLSDVYFAGGILNNIIKNSHSYEEKKFHAAFEELLYNFIDYKDSYNQIRLLDVNGVEIVRANKNSEGDAGLVSKDNLQDKSKHKYYLKAKELDAGMAYISQLDLNIEHGKVEIPYKLVVRVAVPIYHGDRVVNILVANFLGKKILNDAVLILRQGAYDSAGEYFLLNGLGEALAYIHFAALKNEDVDILIGPSVNDVFRKKFGDDYLLILNRSDGVFDEGDRLVALSTFRAESVVNKDDRSIEYGVSEGGGNNYGGGRNNNDLVLVSSTAVKSYYSILYEFLSENITGFIGLGCLCLLVAYFYSESLARQTILENAIKSAAAYDPLTSLYNRRFGILFLEHEIKKHLRNNNDLTLIVIDVNNLKIVNDTCGHNSGDELICTVAEALKNNVRDYDIICRTGGDEFFVAFSGATIDVALEIVERVRSHLVEKYKERFLGVGIDFSYGGVEYNRKIFNTFEEFMNAADAKMYEDKRHRKQGRV